MNGQVGSEDWLQAFQYHLQHLFIAVHSWVGGGAGEELALVVDGFLDEI